MTTTKMTNAKALAFVLGNCELPEEVRERITNIYNSTVKKSVNRKPTKTQEMNKEFEKIVINVLSDGKALTVSEIMKSNDTLGELSNQKVTAILRNMINEDIVNRVKDGKKSVFKLS